MTDQSYDVVAMSFPIVYTIDGDHDPDGLLYTLRAYVPLLRWVRDRWEDDDEALPRLHRRRQLIQIVVDGLWRYEIMREKLAHGPYEDRRLAHDLGGEDDRAARGDGSGRRGDRDPRAAAVRQNFLATVDELVAALVELTDGAADRISPDPVVRAAWRVHWQAALRDVDRLIAERLAAIDTRFDTDLPGLVAESGLKRARVLRLLLNDHRRDVRGLAERTPPYDRVNPLRPLPLARPLVLRAGAGQEVTVEFENQIAGRRVGMHVQGAGLGGTFADGRSGDGVRFGDGAAVGRNKPTVVRTGERHTYRWDAEHEGVWPINDLGDVRGTQPGTNVHGLFGALVVEPPGAVWRDPETGEVLTGTAYADGLYVDVIMPGERPGTDAHRDFVDFHLDDEPRSHREFTVFMHDEPEIHSGLHLVGEHTVMPLSYRAEPMTNRLPHRMRRLAEATPANPPAGQVGVDQSAVRIEIDDELNEVFRVARTPEGEFLERVAGEEQHHSSWLFGDPVTPIFRAYKGDPARVRLVHAGVKETHVFHLHVHQWRAVPQDTAQPSVWRDGQHRGSQLIDSISISPQIAFTIDPLYGSGSRQHSPGDIIWHCHLYPHFHHGMWGLWRSYDRFVDGKTAYPDGTPAHPLCALPGRDPDPVEPGRPGFPWFIDARFPQKSPPPPALRDEFVVGRRRLLRMPNHSAEELAAFAPGVVARPRPGMLFVDLDCDAVEWNAQAGLPPPRIIRYDIDADQTRVEYNSQGWHDRNGHHYRISGISVTQLDENGDELESRTVDPPVRGVEPFFPRANHGDIVELRFHNQLGTIGPDGFDLTTPPVECALHVHLVKFDVLAADGSSTGWNYLTGASCPETVGPNLPGLLPSNVGLHRWVVDEEFGPCFFHDHLLANYRQKHGMFAALIAEPFGAQWLRPDQEEIAWSGPEAVITAPRCDGDRAHQSYREACLAVGDFVPLHNRAGRPLNPPAQLGGDDDPGTMAVNYRCTPLTFRGDDPSEWFSERRGEPDTPVIRTYARERLRIRLIQGSHEEQHSFVTHGLRWRREWHNDRSPLVDQQTLGISEAFTVDLDDAVGAGYGPGDHLWHFAAIDDLWLGCWGLVRALVPGRQAFASLPPLPDLERSPAAALAHLRAARAVPPRPYRRPDGTWSVPVREHVVVARRLEHRYDGRALTDPWGLVYEHAAGWRELPDEPGRPRGRRVATGVERTREPLVLRARRGEWVRVTLINEVLSDDDPRQVPFGVETSPPRLPLESLDDLGNPDERTVTPRVSLHPGLLRYDVVTDDGAYVGRNHDGTVAPPVHAIEGHGGHEEAGGAVVFRDAHGGSHGDPNWREYWWYADDELAPATHREGPGQVCLLRDAADVRNHRHHGLVGALVVEPGDVTPLDPRTRRERWWGTHALIARDVPEAGAPVDPCSVVANEMVLLLQDGLRHFVAGNPDLPVRDIAPDDDPEDSGQKGINYRCAPVHPRRVLRDARPSTPLWRARVGEELWLRLVSAADKPRGHTFTVHGQAWKSAPWLDEKPGERRSPFAGAVPGITAGTVHDLVLRAEEPGDHAYRSGVFRWAVEQGMWGILRIEP